MNEKIIQDLAKLGITGVKKLHYNSSYEELYKFEMDPSLEGFDPAYTPDARPKTNT